MAYTDLIRIHGSYVSGFGLVFHSYMAQRTEDLIFSFILSPFSKNQHSTEVRAVLCSKHALFISIHCYHSIIMK